MSEFNAEVIDRIAGLALDAEVIRWAVPEEQGGVPFLVVEDGRKVVPLHNVIDTDRAERPRREKGTVMVFDAVSFIEYFTRFKDEASAVFADETKNKILAILDYHEPLTGPRWCQHRLDLTLRISEEWRTWKASDKKQMSQVDFAEFLEVNAPDVVEPTAATMLELARTISAKSDITFNSAIRVTSGQVQFTYNEMVKGTFGQVGQFEIPEAFKIRVPIYLGEEPIEVIARLRYRLNSGKVTFWYDLLRSANLEREAFLKVRQNIATVLALTIINGVPA